MTLDQWNCRVASNLYLPVLNIVTAPAVPNMILMSNHNLFPTCTFSGFIYLFPQTAVCLCCDQPKIVPRDSFSWKGEEFHVNTKSYIFGLLQFWWGLTLFAKIALTPEDGLILKRWESDEQWLIKCSSTNHAAEEQRRIVQRDQSISKQYIINSEWLTGSIWQLIIYEVLCPPEMHVAKFMFCPMRRWCIVWYMPRIHNPFMW